MQILQPYSKYIDFLVLHSYPIWGENYADYANSNPNYQASQMPGVHLIL